MSEFPRFLASFHLSLRLPGADLGSLKAPPSQQGASVVWVLGENMLVR